MLRGLVPCGRDVIDLSRNPVVNSFFVAHSSRGLGHLPLKEEITGSNPVCATNGSELSTAENLCLVASR
jgi:hypothetical protein